MDKIKLDNILKSDLISRDLSWLNFNYRVLDQAINEKRNLFERLKFLAISSSNLDEFFTIRVGSLYNYIDFDKKRIDYCGLEQQEFSQLLLKRSKAFVRAQINLLEKDLAPNFNIHGFDIIRYSDLKESERLKVKKYFLTHLYPMLTPTKFDSYHAFPLIRNKTLVLGIVTKTKENNKTKRHLSFLQIPKNISSFYEIERRGKILFLSIAEIIKNHIAQLFRNVEVESVDMFRITRNGDFTLSESDDIENNFVKEVQAKLKKRRTGRVVRLEIESNHNKWMINMLKKRWEITSANIFKYDALIDYTRLWQILKHNKFRSFTTYNYSPVPPKTNIALDKEDNIFEAIAKQDLLLHHPYNSMEPVLELLEKAAEDKNTLAIKQTIYRLADDSRITNALLKAAENGIHVSVLFEVKARFDEEKNIREAKKLEKAGCYVAYGVGLEKTHTKLLMVVRKEKKGVKTYVHLGTGNYNEDTGKLYTDVSLLTSDSVYGHDVSEFFNVITGHSNPDYYTNLITAPRDLRNKLIAFIDREINNVKSEKKGLIIIKVNSLEDDTVIRKFYEASNAGVEIKLIVRGICCLRPGRKGLSENITVKSIVGEFLEHSRLYYFYNGGDEEIYGGSADIMVRSFDRRVESLFKIVDSNCKKEAFNILTFNLLDTENSYSMKENASYTALNSLSKNAFNLHKSFFELG